MKAMTQTAYGPPEEVISLQDVETPQVGDHEVLIGTRAAGVNWADWSLTTGVPYMVRLVSGPSKPRDAVRGTDVAGTIEAVGADVSRFLPGDDVFGWCKGSFAEQVVTGENDLEPKPTNLTFEQAGAVPMAGFVALQTMRDVGKVKPGQKVLVNGASGGIGTFAVQIAKAFGAEVTGVCSTPNLDLVRSIGADHVIDYTEEDFLERGERYDLILDIADNRSLSERRRALTPDGTLVPNSGEGGRWTGSLGRVVGARLLSPFVRQNLHPFLSLPKHEDLVELRELIEDGKVTPVVGRTYSLDETPEAIADVGRRHVRGKSVITV
jgi:NADPH:quinone reductase-like Zn-dependent oxidoreductase